MVLFFSSYFFCVLCFGSLYLCSYLSHYLFPNIFEYLYTHVFVASQYLEITSSTSPLRFAFHLQLIIVSALIITFAIVLHTCGLVLFAFYEFLFHMYLDSNRHLTDSQVLLRIKLAKSSHLHQHVWPFIPCLPCCSAVGAHHICKLLHGVSMVNGVQLV